MVRAVEEFIETLETVSQGVTTTCVNSEKIKSAQEMFKNKAAKEVIQFLMIRLNLHPKVADELRTFEIATNGGLGLPHSQLVNFVANIEGKYIRRNKLCKRQTLQQ